MARSNPTVVEQFVVGLAKPPRSAGDRNEEWWQAGPLWLLGIPFVLVGLPALFWLAALEGWRAATAGLLALAVILFVAARWIRLQERIRDVAHEWQLTIDTVEFPILTLDYDSRILRMNRAAMVLSGRPYVENLGKRIADLGSQEPWRSAQTLVARVRALGEIRALETRDPADGQTWEVTVQPVQNPGKAQPTLIVLAQNVTEKVALQESLRRRELMSALGSLVGGVAHDVRNFLQGTTGILDRLETKIGDQEDLKPLMGALRRESERMTDLTQGLLEYGKPVERASESVALSTVIEEARGACAPAAEERGVELEIESEEAGLTFAMDPGRMLQVFLNLIENAIQHSPVGGRVTVNTRRVGSWIVSEVRDSGSGLAPEDLPRIFEPFYTRREGGTGLGLVIVQRIVGEHGGEVEAANRPEGGAVFRVRLPVKTAA